MSALAIVLIVVAAVFAILFAGGVAYTVRRRRREGSVYAEHIAEADQALERARAADRGWDRGRLEDAAWRGLAAHRPDQAYDELHLILVDDRPGVTEDRAHIVATSAAEEVRIVLLRRGDDWEIETLG